MKIKSALIVLLINIIAIRADDMIAPLAKCGSGVGTCPDNSCCSKYGFCGTSENHCDISKGCQTSYGLCYTNDKRCGSGVGLCKDNLCCSKYGYCGSTDAHCNIDKGCQLSFGLCYESDNGGNNGDSKECGKGYGKCSNNKCCSSSGKCGTSDSYCNINKGCQVDYGTCYKPITNIREGSGNKCGKNVGSCSFPDCCSKSGKCVLGTSECLDSNGCQSDYGLCLTKA